MSALTKAFIILLVVCSLLFTAGTVVFVNRVEDFKKTAETEGAAKTRAEQRARDAEAAAAAAAARAQDAVRTQNEQVAAKTKDLLDAQRSIAARDAQVADLSSKIALQQVSLTGVSEALKASESTKALQMTQITELRGKVDDLTGTNLDLNTRVADLTNKLDQTERDRRFLAEQVAQLQQDNSKLAAALKDNGIKLQDLAAAPPFGLKAGAPPINGVIREVRAIAGGIPYATISVGSADSVTKGMEFKVIDRDKGDFLGVLTVDNVEPNEATGKLTGPRVQDIQKGNEARTQL